MTAVVGIDLGTTSSKALLRDLDGRDLALVERRTPWTTTSRGGTQTPADTFVRIVVELLTELAREAASRRCRIDAIGIAGLAESGVLLDGAGDPVTPVVAWFDPRGAAEVAEISRREPGFAAEFARRTGLPWDSQASVATLLWFAAAGLELRPGHRWSSVPEHVLRRLGGELVSEPSLASRTGLLDQATGRAWADGAAALGLPAGLLPESRTAGTAAGTLRSPGLPAAVQGAVLTVAGHDHPVAAIGVGVTGPDELFNSTGTADVLARSLPGRLTDGQRKELVGQGLSVGAHVLPGTTLLLGGVRGGLVLRRVLGLLGAVGAADRDRLDVAALAVGELPVGLSVTGAGPTGDDVLVRLRDDADPAAVWAAATRHTAEETQALLRRMHQVVRPHRRAVASGGWTRMASVRRAKAAAIDHLEFSAVPEPGVLGAAVLAGQALAPLPQTTISTLSKESA